jgi:tetratricopeptide (TPR) repeat protein
MKRSILIIFLLTFVLSSGCAYYNTFYNAKKFYKDAEKDRKKREKTQVVELSAEEEAQLKKSGRSGSDTKNRASQQEMQNYQQAIERASRVLEFYPDSKWIDDALMLLGKCFFYRRDFKKGMRKFDEILQLYPNSEFIPETRLLKARAYIGLDEFDAAEEMLKEISFDETVPKSVREEAKYQLGGLYFKKKNYELAAENYKSSARSAKDKLIKAMAQYRLGECLVRLENFEEAPAVLRKAVKDAPNEDFLSQAMFKLGQSYSMNGDYDRSIKTFKNALSKEYDVKRIPRIKLELANNLKEMGKLSEAIRWYENIIEEHKRTDASARSYYALGQVEEFISEDYVKAKENYDLVRSEFSASLIAPIAKERSNNIQTFLELQKEIATLEGRAVEGDSLSDGTNGEIVEERDDGPIDLSADGMWINYSGRDRPPPFGLRDLTEADLARQAAMQERVAEMIASGDSTKIDSSMFIQAPLDSAALALQAKEEARAKETELSSKYLALAEVMLFAFDKPDSAVKYYQVVVDKHVDSVQVARALYSLAHVYSDFLVDSVLSEMVLKDLVDIFPETNHAEGARKLLGIDLFVNEIDSAEILFDQAEAAFYRQNNLERAFELWDEISIDHPESEYAAKATFAKAWHYENTLFNLDSAITAYESMIELFPESPFTETAKPKLAAVENERKEEEARQKATADSLAKIVAAAADSAAADSIAAAAADSTNALVPDVQATLDTAKTLQSAEPLAGEPPTTAPATVDTAGAAVPPAEINEDAKTAAPVSDSTKPQPIVDDDSAKTPDADSKSPPEKDKKPEPRTVKEPNVKK